MQILELDRMRQCDEKMLEHTEVITDVNLFDSYHRMDIVNGFRSEAEIKEAFNIIGVNYDSIEMDSRGNIRYNVGDYSLFLGELSSGERAILYLMACKKLKKPLVFMGLLERLGGKLTKVAYEQLKDYNELTLINCNRKLPREFKPYLIN